MTALLRRYRWPALCTAVLLAIALVAQLDHEHKRDATNAAQVSEWFCAHKGERCGGPSSARIQRRWEARERGYRVAFAVVSAAGVLLLVTTRRRQP